MPILREQNQDSYSVKEVAQWFSTMGYGYVLAHAAGMLRHEFAEKTKRTDVLMDWPKVESLLKERSEFKQVENVLEREFAPSFLIGPSKVIKRVTISRPHLQLASRKQELRNLEKRILASPMSSSVVLASGPVVIKAAIEDSEFLEEARRPGSTLPKDLLQICTDRGIEPGPDQFVACVAFYVFGAVKFDESMSYVLSYTARHERELPTGWASHFATHALKILTEQKDRDDRYFFYDTVHRQDAINRALKYVYR